MIRTKNLIHPGEILKEEFLDPMGISQNRLALDFGTGPEFWQNLQSHYDLCIAQKKLDAERFSILPFLRTAAAL